MKRILTTMAAAVGVCALLGSSAAAQQSDTASTQSQSQTGGSEQSLSSSGRSFVEQAAAENAAEVKLGKLAKDKASNDDVKDFAERMIEDHQKATEQLKRAVPQQLVASQELKPKHQKTYDQLSKLSGEEFDREYIKHMVKDHEKAVKLFRKQANQSSDRELSQFASATLPKLEDHLQEAKQIQSDLRDSGSRGTTGTSDPGSSDIHDRDPEEALDPGDDIDDPGHSEPPPPAPTPDPTERP